MKLDAQEIKDLVDETERKQHNWVAWADELEAMWFGCNYEDSPEDYRDMDGLEAITLPDPFNIIQLLQRFVASDTRVEIPYLTQKDEDNARSDLMEEWTMAFDEESNRQLGKHHTQGKTWMSGVLGRGASRVIWTGGIVPSGLQDRLPILRENIDPRNVGVARGPFGTEWAYHTYKTTRSYIERYYPDYKLPERGSNAPPNGYWNEKFTVIDFWAWHKKTKKGDVKVWHTVTINDKVAMAPKETDYPDIPIIVWNGDGAPVDNQLGQSVGILHPIRDAYRAKNDFVSTMITGLKYHYHPMVIAKNMGDQKISMGPGQIAYLSGDQSIDSFRAEPNVPMAQALLQILQSSIDQATFSSVAWGEGESGASGYAINSLSQAARSRANIIRTNIESAMEAENQLIYGIVDRIIGDEGVQIYGRSARGDKGKPILLRAKDIKGNYANKVTLVPESPMDDNARIMAWLQMVDKKIVSKDMMRNRIINVATPRDEETRVAYETALELPELQQKVMIRAMQASMSQEDFERNIVGTPLEAVWQAEVAWLEQKAQEAEAEKQRKAEEKAQKEMQEMMASMPPMPPQDPMGGLPPDMGMMNPGMPPGMDMSGMPPPGGMPPEMGGMSPDMGGLPPMPPSPDGMSMQPPGMPPGMMPAEMSPQMTPESLGLGPGAPPGLFQDLTGQSLDDADMFKRLSGIPRQ
jgi:hypothetical protein